MKKLVVFAIIVLMLCCSGLNVVRDLSLSSIFPNAEVEVFLPEKVEVEGVKCVDNGSGCVVFVNICDLDYILNNFCICGFTIKIVGDIKDVVNKIKPNFYVDTSDCVYGYKNGLFANSVNKYNFQCVERDNFVLLGAPIILGCY